jgi:hypothetical protein
MNTIVPTSCIVVAGQELRQWRKLYRNKINMFGKSWTEHVYEFIPAWKPISSPEGIGEPYEIRVYKNQEGLVIWAVGKDHWCGTNGLWPKINKNLIDSGYDAIGQRFNFPAQTDWLGKKKEWQRSYSDVRFLLSFERTKKDFIAGVTEYRKTWLLFPSKEVEDAVWSAVSRAESGRGRSSIGAYSGPASLSTEELKSLGCRVCHRPPTKKFPQVAPSDNVIENFNWGARTPERSEWFRYGAGYSYHGTVGCNSGWVWYD